MIIKRSYVFFMLLVVVVGCKTSILPEKEVLLLNDPVELMINNIYCLNMSEKLLGVGSKNDEIILLVFQINDKAENKLIASTDFLIFEKEDSMGQALDITIVHDSERKSNELHFLLIEMDTDRTKDEVAQLTGSLLNEKFELPVIKEKLREDDLLGIETLSNIHTSEKGRLRFFGMHLFDKFHYEISFEFITL